MRVLVLLSLFLTLAHGKNQRVLLGKPLSVKTERLLKKEHTERRRATGTNSNVNVPEKRRLSDAIKSRKLPFGMLVELHSLHIYPE
jgi:hypothetical protein